MPVKVTRKWSAERHAKGESAHDEYEVTGVRSCTEAAAAVSEVADPGTTPEAIPQAGTTHRDDGDLISNEPYSQRTHFSMWTVSVDYGPASDGPIIGPSPLNSPPRFSWAKEEYGEQTDADFFGNALLNSARDRFDPPPSTNRAVRVLCVKWFQRTYELDRAEAFEDHVNEETLAIPLSGGKIVQPGQLLCKAILPTGEYSRATPHIEIAAFFHLKRGVHPWQWRFLDQGFKAMYAEPEGPVPGELFDRKGNQLSTEARLNGHGIPFDTSHVQITATNETAFSINPPPGSVIELTESAAFLRYLRVAPAAFMQLGIFEKPTGGGLIDFFPVT